MIKNIAILFFLTLIFGCSNSNHSANQCTTPTSQSTNRNVDLVANIDPLEFKYAYSDVWAENGVAFVGTILEGGVAIIDISNPTSPALHANYLPGLGASFGDIKVQNSIGYFASLSGDGVHIVDVSNPTNPTLTSIIYSSIGGFNSVHNLFIDGSHLYIVSDDPPTTTIKVFNVDDPYNPYFVRNISATDSLFVHDITVQNGKLYASSFGGITDIFDVSAVAVQPPSWLGSVNTGSNSHSNWPTEDGNYLVSAQEIYDGEVRIYDISNAASPFLVSTINGNTTSENLVSPHNPVVNGNLLYISWYEAGLHVYDISNPANPELIAIYDTTNQSDEYPFCNPDGIWGVYPFLGSDKILLSGMRNGLYIVNITSAL